MTSTHVQDGNLKCPRTGKIRVVVQLKWTGGGKLTHPLWRIMKKIIGIFFSMCVLAVSLAAQVSPCASYSSTENTNVSLTGNAEHSGSFNHSVNWICTRKCTYSPAPSNEVETIDRRNQFVKDGVPPMAPPCGVTAETDITLYTAGDGTTNNGRSHRLNHGEMGTSQSVSWIQGGTYAYSYGYAAMSVESCAAYDFTCWVTSISFDSRGNPTYTEHPGLSGYNLDEQQANIPINTCTPRYGD